MITAEREPDKSCSITITAEDTCNLLGCVCLTDSFVSVSWELYRQKLTLLSRQCSRLVLDSLALRFNPRGWTWACSCSLLCSQMARITLWTLRKSGILCPLQAEQSSDTNSGPRNTHLAKAKSQYPIGNESNDNQMSKAFVSASRSSGVAKRLWRTLDMWIGQEGSDLVSQWVF